MKQTLNLLLVLALFTVGQFTLAAGFYYFTDFQQVSTWAQQSVKNLADLKIIQGYEDGSFKPNDPVTRAELAVLLDRLEQKTIDADDLENVLLTLAQNNTPQTSLGAKIAMALADSGLKKVPAIPTEEVHETSLLGLSSDYVAYKTEGSSGYYLYNSAADQWYGVFFD